MNQDATVNRDTLTSDLTSRTVKPSGETRWLPLQLPLRRIICVDLHYIVFQCFARKFDCFVVFLRIRRAKKENLTILGIEKDLK